jgi:hypothetical protein
VREKPIIKEVSMTKRGQSILSIACCLAFAFGLISPAVARGDDHHGDGRGGGGRSDQSSRQWHSNDSQSFHKSQQSDPKSTKNTKAGWHWGGGGGVGKHDDPDATPKPTPTPLTEAEKCQNSQDRANRWIGLATSWVQGFESRAQAKVADDVAFYNNQVLPNGGSVDNYDALLANVNSTKAALDAALAAAAADVADGVCPGDPGDAKASFQALRTAVWNYWKAVGAFHQAVRDEHSKHWHWKWWHWNKHHTPSPSPTPTPEPSPAPTP